LENNVVMAITLFDNQTAAAAADKSFVVWACEQELQTLLTGPHEVLSGEVVVHVIEPSAPFETGGGYGA